MLPTRTRLIATAALGTVLIAGCRISLGTAEPEPTIAPPSTARSSASAPATTPAPTPTPTPTASIARLTTQQILKKAEAAAKAATGVRVHGTMNMADGTTLKLNVRLARSGGSGTVGFDGTGMSVIVVGRTAFVQVDDSFWRQDKKKSKDAELFIQLLRGKWLKLALDNEGLGEMAGFASKATFFDGMFTDPGSTLRKTAAKTIDGVSCVGLRGTDGTFWVDATNARPIRLELSGRGGTGGLSFSEYNQIKAPKAPPPAQVVDGKALGL